MLNLGLVAAMPTAPQLDEWVAERGSGTPLDALALGLLLDSRYFARF